MFNDPYAERFKDFFAGTISAAPAHPSSGNRVAFLTSSKTEISQLAQTLASGIAMEFLTDPKKPLLFSVIGGYQTGKKLIADTVHETLLKEDVLLEGIHNTDEYRCGHYNGRLIEIDFINLKDTGFSDKKLEPPKGLLKRLVLGDKGLQQHVADNFLHKRQYGGVSLIHNGEKAQIPYDIEIFLQSPHDAHERIGDVSRIENYPHLRSEFYKVTNNQAHEWARLVEITIHNPVLLQSEQFSGALKKLPAPTLR